MVLPTPSASFILPSLYDDLELNCRLYYPRARAEGDGLTNRGCAILAHPYSSLGGTYDDPVVQSVGSTLIKNGFMLATFNFRGAEKSPGKTSWSGKGELGDYVSIYALMLAFMNTPGVIEYMSAPLLLLGGYSYGSMIASHVPDLKVILDILQNAKVGSTEHEIEHRAQELAHAFLGYYETRDQRGRSSLHVPPRPTMSIATMGGYESPLAARRISRENSRRSVDAERMREGVDRVRQKLHRTHNSQDSDKTSRKESNASETLRVLPDLAYLLVSPVLGPVSSFATMFSALKFERKDRNATAAREVPVTDPIMVLSQNPSMLIFGTNDHFTSSRKVREWVQAGKAKPGSKLAFREVPQAGHFWHEESLDAQLRDIVLGWLKSLP